MNRRSDALKVGVAFAIRSLLLNNAIDLTERIQSNVGVNTVDLSVVDDLNLSLKVRTQRGTRYFNIKISELM